MRKNKMMRAASGLLVAVLLSTCAISGTFAKYTTSANGTDSARVAKWGFTGGSTITISDLFKNTYDTTVKSSTDVIAPGTTGSAKFGFTYGGDGSVTAPEVAYTFKVSTEGSSCADSIKNNTNIKWKLDTGEWVTWDQLIAAIEALDGNKTDDRYEPNTLPTAFNTPGENKHTVSWQWLFETSGEGKGVQDTTDTDMGNAAELAKVELKITVTATQID